MCARLSDHTCSRGPLGHSRPGWGGRRCSSGGRRPGSGHTLHLRPRDVVVVGTPLGAVAVMNLHDVVAVVTTLSHAVAAVMTLHAVAVVMTLRDVVTILSVVVVAVVEEI